MVPETEDVMTKERTPEHTESLMGGKAKTSPWKLAHDRLAKPEEARTCWLATTRPDGRPHLMPVIAFWIEGAFHFVAGEGTQKGHNLAADSHCVIGTGSRKLPSLDVIVEGRAKPITDAKEVRRLAEIFKANGWALEAKGDEVFGPNAPTAGPPPYRIYRMVPSTAFGLPGTYGMEKAKQEDLPKPTRWTFPSK
jgi:hypothetical protein